MASTILLRGWRQQKQPFRKHFASAQMQAKHTSRERIIFIMDTAITTALWLNWKLPRRTLPNDPRVFELMGYIQRRQGHWEESTRNLERAIELDPRDISMLYQIGDSYAFLRRYAEQKSTFDRILAIEPNNLGAKAERAFVEVDWKADTRPLHQLIDEIRATNPAAMPKITIPMRGSFAHWPNATSLPPKTP